MLKPLIASALIAVSLAATAVPANAESALEQYKRSCANVLNFLPRIVRKSTVAAIPDDAHVSLHFICTGVELNDFGNAAGLGPTIAANDALRHALARWGLRADNVISIQITGNTVQLYVHRA
jgi:hypothetical protein